MARMMKKYEDLANNSRDLYKEMKRNEKNKNMDIVNILVDAVVASGKKFGEIPKESIFAYLDKAGINRSKWQGIYDTLASNFKQTKPTVKVVEDNRPKSVVDYTKVSIKNLKKCDDLF